MTDNPPVGAVSKYGPFIRNPQPIGKGLFLVESQRGTKGTGKVWYPAIVQRNPRYTPGSDHFQERSEWRLCADVRPQQGKYVIDGYVKASVWWDDDRERRHGIEGYFPEELIGVQFIVRVAVDFVR